MSARSSQPRLFRGTHELVLISAEVALLHLVHLSVDVVERPSAFALDLGEVVSREPRATERAALTERSLFWPGAGEASTTEASRAVTKVLRSMAKVERGKASEKCERKR